jgi:signal transduction histidine kinase
MDLCDTILAIVEELRSAYPERALEVECPPVRGTWDRDRLEQVFSNLISNAITHGDPKRPVRVEARVEGAFARVAVHNEGPAIPAELQATLFDPFRRGDRDSRTAKTAGLGLGLYISREIVSAHGGQLDLASDSVRGTTFRVSLPMTAATSE